MPILASPDVLTATACPSWCRLPVGHAPEFDVDGTAAVVHRAVVLADSPAATGSTSRARLRRPRRHHRARAARRARRRTRRPRPDREQARRQAAALAWAADALAGGTW